MSKHVIVLLIAVFAGFFQSLAERVAKEVEISALAPNLFGWARESACRSFTDGPTGSCANREMPALEVKPIEPLKAICHRKPQ